MTRVWLVAVLAAACGGKALEPDAATAGSDATTDAADGWTPLISRQWTLDASLEAYRCRRIQVPQDMWVTGFRALSPPGTHHAVLTISTTSTPLGDYDCSPGNLDNQLLYASGVNTDDLVFPTGIAIHLTAGQYINLNLHLFNATDTALAEESGVLVKTIAAGDVVHEADMTFAGTINISIPNDGQPHTAQGGCVAPSDWHVFALWPHMHETATHQTMIVTHLQSPTTMLDTPYSFVDQKNYTMPDTLIQQGDQVMVTCTYVNTTAINPMTFGDSTNAEMCFTGLYKYPAGDSLYACTSN